MQARFDENDPKDRKNTLAKNNAFVVHLIPYINSETFECTDLLQQLIDHLSQNHAIEGKEAALLATLNDTAKAIFEDGIFAFETHSNKNLLHSIATLLTENFRNLEKAQQDVIKTRLAEINAIQKSIDDEPSNSINAESQKDILRYANEIADVVNPAPAAEDDSDQDAIRDDIESDEDSEEALDLSFMASEPAPAPIAGAVPQQKHDLTPIIEELNEEQRQLRQERSDLQNRIADIQQNKEDEDDKNSICADLQIRVDELDALIAQKQGHIDALRRMLPQPTTTVSATTPAAPTSTKNVLGRLREFFHKKTKEPTQSRVDTPKVPSPKFSGTINVNNVIDRIENFELPASEKGKEEETEKGIEALNAGPLEGTDFELAKDAATGSVTLTKNGTTLRINKDGSFRTEEPSDAAVVREAVDVLLTLCQTLAINPNTVSVHGKTDAAIYFNDRRKRPALFVEPLPHTTVGPQQSVQKLLVPHINEINADLKKRGSPYTLKGRSPGKYYLDGPLKITIHEDGRMVTHDETEKDKKNKKAYAENIAAAMRAVSVVNFHLGRIYDECNWVPDPDVKDEPGFTETTNAIQEEFKGKLDAGDVVLSASPSVQPAPQSKREEYNLPKLLKANPYIAEAIKKAVGTRSYLLADDKTSMTRSWDKRKITLKEDGTLEAPRLTGGTERELIAKLVSDLIVMLRFYVTLYIKGGIQALPSDSLDFRITPRELDVIQQEKYAAMIPKIQAQFMQELGKTTGVIDKRSYYPDSFKALIQFNGVDVAPHLSKKRAASSEPGNEPSAKRPTKR